MSRVELAHLIFFFSPKKCLFSVFLAKCALIFTEMYGKLESAPASPLRPPHAEKARKRIDGLAASCLTSLINHDGKRAVDSLYADLCGKIT
jgi:hypothetical protein